MFIEMKTITKYAKEHRKNPTLAELELKKKLLRWHIKFRSQRQFDFYIVDFLIPYKRLIIEVDGEYHLKNRQNDLRREAYLKQLGLDIIRITNNEVLTTNCEWLKEEILKREDVNIRNLPPRESWGRSKY